MYTFSLLLGRPKSREMGSMSFRIVLETPSVPYVECFYADISKWCLHTLLPGEESGGSWVLVMYFCYCFLKLRNFVQDLYLQSAAALNTLAVGLQVWGILTLLAWFLMFSTYQSFLLFKFYVLMREERYWEINSGISTYLKWNLAL